MERLVYRTTRVHLMMRWIPRIFLVGVFVFPGFAFTVESGFFFGPIGYSDSESFAIRDSTIQLTVQRPKVFGVLPPFSVEDTTDPVQTVPNFDNDDGDAFLDVEDQDGVEGGDDELVRLRLKSNVFGRAQFHVLDEDGKIRIWQDSTKLVPVSDTTVPVSRGGCFQAEIWIEGIEGSNAERDARVVGQWLDSSKRILFSDTVRIRILDADGIEWMGRGNGFTPYEVDHDADLLDSDPNFPYGDLMPESRRVFPGARRDNPSVPRDLVDLWVSLSSLPVERLCLHIRSFDVDDPSSDSAWIDPNDLGSAGRYRGTTLSYTADEDNRGSTRAGGGRAAKFVQKKDHERNRICFEAGQRMASVRFQTSHYPGDNYRVALNADSNFVSQLRNFDRTDGFDLVDSRTQGSVKSRLNSPVLTVWRLLHIENDSMRGPENRGTSAKLTGFEKLPGSFGYKLFVDIDLDDGSMNHDDSPQGAGRFQGGRLHVVSGGENVPVVSNGNRSLIVNAVPSQFLAGVDLSLSDNTVIGNQVIWGTLADVVTAKSGWRVIFKPVSSKTANFISSRFDGGFVRMGGGNPVFVQKAYPLDGVIEVNELSVPVIIEDDDDPFVLPSYSNLTGLNAYNEAYIWPVDDGGGVDGNQDDVPFISNVPLTSSFLDNMTYINRDSRSVESPAFWVVYLLSTYEAQANLPVPRQSYVRGDGDPDGEMGINGVTPPFGSSADFRLAPGGSGSLLFRETERDVSHSAFSSSTLHTLNVSHEVGHQFGLGHGQGGLMDPQLRKGSRLVQVSVHFIRSRLQSPGN